MFIVKAMFAIGVMTLAIFIVPIQVASLLMKRNRYDPITSDCIVIPTAFQENACSHLTTVSPSDVEKKGLTIKTVKNDCNVVH